MTTRIVIGLLLAALAGAAQPVSIRMGDASFRVEGWHAAEAPADGWGSYFQVYAGAGGVPAMLGSYAVEEGALVFRPRFPVAPGMQVRAVFRAPGAAPVEAAFEIPKPTLAATTRVAHVYPSTNVLPENQLKFYIYFSAPMSKGLAWKKIHLLDEHGKAVTLPFLELDEELWDRDGLRLTVLFDPGRIKREVLPLKEMGPSIQSGGRYTLLIDADWPDGRGVPMAEAHRKEFRVGAADRTPPEVNTWKVTAPRAGTSEPLVVDFPEAMDYALLQHLIEVSGPDGAVSGTVAVAKDEQQWRFTPSQPWKSGSYELSVQTTLEDLAGNHIGRPFDVDTFERITRTIPRGAVSLKFRTRS